LYTTELNLLATRNNTGRELSLSEALAAGDQRSITEFYNTSGPVLLTVCRRYANSEEHAEDLFHEGFMHILQQIKKFGGQSSLQTWAYRVMANFCINQIRKAFFKIQWVDIGHAQLEDEADDTYEEDFKLHNMEKILDLMQQMPTGFRLVINMYAVEGKTHAEIAKELGVTESTSKTQLFKARKWLKNRMKGIDNGE
jgi:RNA polymerase sigma-70 factor (ECF subfamily)